MQLDLLQKELLPPIVDSNSQPIKNPPSITQTPASQELPLIDSLPPLPQTLRPVLGETSVDHIVDDEKLLEKLPSAFKTISEAASVLSVPQHVLRFWESRFSQIKPLKLRGGRRYYRPEDMEILSSIKHLLYNQGYTIKGAKKAFSLRNKSKETLAGIASTIQAVLPEKRISPDKKTASQLSAIREELMGLRDQLKAYLA